MPCLRPKAYGPPAVRRGSAESGERQAAPKEADERRRTEEQAEVAAAESAKKAKKARKTAAIVAAAICGCAVVAVLLYKIVIPSYKLNQADKLAASGNYEAAFMLLDELNYKNSEEKRERILQTTKREDVGLYYKLLFNETNVMIRFPLVYMNRTVMLQW